MTTAPSDLAAFRTGTVIPLTGLSGNDVGIAPDSAHLSSGGYHVGPDDIRRIGRYSTDYSVRQARDRVAGNDAAALDIGDDWPRGGRAAWLRFNNSLVAQLRAGDPALAAVRAVNFSPDGSACRRYDSFNPGQGVVSSTDSVYMHTHLEFWRDTAGTPARARALARVGQIIDAAIRNVPLEDEMPNAAEINASRNSWAVTQLQEKYKVFPGDVDGSKEVEVTSALAAAIKRIDAGVAALVARPAVDPTELAAALAPVLADHLGAEVSADAVLTALTSDAGQAALVKAANRAEDE